MTTDSDKKIKDEIKREEVTLKKPLTQGREEKKAGEKIYVTPDQKTRLNKKSIV